MEIIEEIGRIQVGYKDYPEVKIEIVESGELTSLGQVRLLSPPVPIICRPLQNAPVMLPQPRSAKNNSVPASGHKRTHSKQATMLEVQQEAVAVAAGRGDADENRCAKRRIVMFEQRDDDYDMKNGGPSTQPFTRRYDSPGHSPHKALPPGRSLRNGHRTQSLPLAMSHGRGCLYPGNSNEGECNSDDEEGREIPRHRGLRTDHTGNNYYDRYDNRIPSDSILMGVSAEGLSNCTELEDGLAMGCVEIVLLNLQNGFLALSPLRRHCYPCNGHLVFALLHVGVSLYFTYDICTLLPQAFAEIKAFPDFRSSNCCTGVRLSCILYLRHTVPQATKNTRFYF